MDIEIGIEIYNHDFPKHEEKIRSLIRSFNERKPIQIMGIDFIVHAYSSTCSRDTMGISITLQEICE